MGADAERKKNYRGLFAAQMDIALVEEITKSTNGNFVLGKSLFTVEVEQVLAQRVRPLKSGRPAKAGS